ncbi:DoxX family protein [Streptomyces nodosus]|uniref:DoxX family protein n=1 Tax=Streptomyces nodosus TaxID=40318 RepID=UPI00381BE76D
MQKQPQKVQRRFDLGPRPGLVAGPARAPLGTAAALGLVPLLVGAVSAHRRSGDALPALVPPAWLALPSAVTAVVGTVP